MEIELINLHLGIAIYGCGFVAPICGMFDDDGDDCEPDEAVACTIGPLPGDGLYFTTRLDDYDFGYDH